MVSSEKGGAWQAWRRELPLCPSVVGRLEPPAVAEAHLAHDQQGSLQWKQHGPLAMLRSTADLKPKQAAIT